MISFLQCLLAFVFVFELVPATSWILSENFYLSSNVGVYTEAQRPLLCSQVLQSPPPPLQHLRNHPRPRVV